MKHISKIIAASFIGLIFGTANAQDVNHPWAISVGVNAVDFISEEDIIEDGRFFKGGLYNVLPSISEITVGRYITRGFSGKLSGSLNKIDTIGNGATDDSPSFTVDDLSYFSLEGLLSYDLRNVVAKKDGWFAPYLGFGAAYSWIDDNGSFSLDGTFGIDFWLKENFAIYLESTYKGVVSEYRDSSENIIADGQSFQASHIQHSAGVKFVFGGTDTDGDGVYDNKDECPEVAGLKQFNGCPDSDLDGIKDADDSCPNEAGTVENNGCPDSDGDGIVDKDDSCPQVAGSAAMKGCPDSDGDGVADNVDNCPNEGGPATNNGCPYADKDKDGVLDKDDKCPDVPGLVSNNGCPEVKVVTAEVQKTLNDYAKTILFDTGKATIKAQSEAVLGDITTILKEYPKANFTIDGHTDSVGSSSSNQRLSESRASSVKAFLINKGISTSRLSSKGYGEAAPISSNATKQGRALNRRVEINLVK